MFMLMLREIRHRWLIHMLVILLMGFVISILIIQSSLNSSAEDKIKELTHDLGKGMLVVPEGTDLESFYSMKYGPQVMPDDYGDRIKQSPVGRHAGKIQPWLYGNINIRGKELIIVGRKLRNQRYGNADYHSISIGKGASESLGIKSGDMLDVRGNSFRVARVLDPPPKGYDMALFIPLRAAQNILDKPGKINALNLGGCWCKLDVAGFASEVEKNLPGTMAITVDGMAKAQTQINATMEQYSLMLWIIGIILVIGSIVFLILYMLRKSEREIGLLLSIGLSPGKIVSKNVIISIITAVIGALLGHIFSVPLMSSFGKAFMRIVLVPSWEFLPHYITSAALIALVASSLPTWFVTRLEPTRLLREE